MCNRLIAAWAVLLLLTATVGGAVDPLHLDDVVEEMRMPGVNTTIEWADCGEVNAYYTPSLQTVTMCRELLPYGGPFIRFVLAHELAHGVIRQRDIPYTGSQEVAADELAAVVLSLYHDQEAVLAAANFWFQQGNPEIPWDPHPGNVRRGYTLSCLADTSKGDYSSFYCSQGAFQTARHTWMRLLRLDP